MAFDAFSCFTFQSSDDGLGASFLVADVDIECGSVRHHQAQSLALLAIFVYPVGLFAINAVLLFCAHKAIITKRETVLSRCTAFLHKEYRPVLPYIFWELVEMVRRLLLVGAYVVGPFHPGSMMQLATAALTCVIYLFIQQQAMPYREFADNFLAVACSLSLVVIFLTSIFYK